MEHDGNVKASRWCAGCHDPVPFFSGAFDDPNFDDVNHPTAHAGITCTVCHAMTHIHGTTGNAAFTIGKPPHYPFTFSKNPLLQWINNQLVKAKPDFHKKTFLKPFHKTAEFCSTCHKVSLPVALNHYKEFLRGQNHYDSRSCSAASPVTGPAASTIRPRRSRTVPIATCRWSRATTSPPRTSTAAAFASATTTASRPRTPACSLCSNTRNATSTTPTASSVLSIAMPRSSRTTKLRIDLFGLQRRRHDRRETARPHSTRAAAPSTRESVSRRGRHPDGQPGASLLAGHD